MRPGSECIVDASIRGRVAKLTRRGSPFVDVLRRSDDGPIGRWEKGLRPSPVSREQGIDARLDRQTRRPGAEDNPLESRARDAVFFYGTGGRLLPSGIHFLRLTAGQECSRSQLAGHSVLIGSVGNPGGYPASSQACEGLPTRVAGFAYGARSRCEKLPRSPCPAGISIRDPEQGPR